MSGERKREEWREDLKRGVLEMGVKNNLKLQAMGFV